MLPGSDAPRPAEASDPAGRKWTMTDRLPRALGRFRVCRCVSRGPPLVNLKRIRSTKADWTSGVECGVRQRAYRISREGASSPALPRDAPSFSRLSVSSNASLTLRRVGIAPRVGALVLDPAVVALDPHLGAVAFTSSTLRATAASLLA